MAGSTGQETLYSWEDLLRIEERRRWNALDHTAKRREAIEHISRNASRTARTILEYAAGYAEATHSGVSLLSWSDKQSERNAEVLFDTIFQGYWNFDKAVESIVANPDPTERNLFDRRLREALTVYLYAIDAAHPLTCPRSTEKDWVPARMLRCDFSHICTETGADEMLSSLFSGVPLRMVAPGDNGGCYSPVFARRSFNPIYVC